MYKTLFVLWILSVVIIIIVGLLFGNEYSLIIQNILYTSSVPFTTLLLGWGDADFIISIMSSIDIEK